MRLNYGLIGLTIASLSSAAAAAQDETTSSSQPLSGDSGHAELAHPRIGVHCRAQNTFGYIADVQGTLKLGSRTAYNQISVSGSLELDAHFIDAASRPRMVDVQGTVDMFGQYVFADVTWGADDLASVFFAFGPGSSSYVQAKDSTQYQTDCSSSQVRLPQVADLTPTGKLRFEALPDGPQRAQLEVLNVGNASVTGPAARIRIAGQDVHGTLYNAARTSNVLGAGEQGTIEVELPAATLTRCGSYAVILDLDHQLQHGAFDPFANDAGQAATPCLRWTTPITEEMLGAPVDPKIAYETLDGIVNSQLVARADGKRCNQCHFAGSGMTYSPGAGTITPTQQVGSHAWSGYDGWAFEFYNQPDTVKPAYLKAAFRRWLDDGGQ